MKKLKFIPVALLLVISTVSMGSAALITLHNGDLIEGNIVKNENSQFTINTEFGVAIVNAEKIYSITLQSRSEAEYIVDTYIKIPLEYNHKREQFISRLFTTRVLTVEMLAMSFQEWAAFLEIPLTQNKATKTTEETEKTTNEEASFEFKAEASAKITIHISFGKTEKNSNTEESTSENTTENNDESNACTVPKQTTTTTTTTVSTRPNYNLGELEECEEECDCEEEVIENDNNNTTNDNKTNKRQDGIIKDFPDGEDLKNNIDSGNSNKSEAKKSKVAFGIRATGTVLPSGEITSGLGLNFRILSKNGLITDFGVDYLGDLLSLTGEGYGTSSVSYPSMNFNLSYALVNTKGFLLYTGLGLSFAILDQGYDFPVYAYGDDDCPYCDIYSGYGGYKDIEAIGELNFIGGIEFFLSKSFSVNFEMTYPILSTNENTGARYMSALNYYL